MNDKPKFSPSPLRLNKETLKELRVHSGVRTGIESTVTEGAQCFTAITCQAHDSCLRITMNCAK